MVSLKSKANEIVRRETARFDYKGSIKEIKENLNTPCFSGMINLSTNPSIQLEFNPEYTEESEDLEEIVGKNPFGEAFTALTKHELNHRGGGDHKGCPRSLDLHMERVLEPVSRVFKESVIPNVQVNQYQRLYEYFANLFNDFIDNSELGNKKDPIGLSLLYKDDAEHLETKQFTSLFEAFLKLQDKFYGGKRSRKLLNEHYQESEKASNAVNNFLDRTGLSKFKRKKLTRRKKEKVDLFDRKKALEYCLNEENWRELSRIFTEEFIELIDKDKLKDTYYLSSTFIPLRGEDGFSDEASNPEARMKVAFKRYSESSGAFEPPAFLDDFEALDLVYQKLARGLEIKTRISTRSTSIPVMEYGRRKFDPRKDKLSKTKVRMGKNGLELTVKPYHEDFPVEYESRKQNIPNIRFVHLDTSGSMKRPVDPLKTGKIMNQWAPKNRQWDDNSRYHYGLISWYALLELSRKQGTLRHNSVKFVNYSNLTKGSRNLRDSKKSALTPQFGGTELEIDDIGGLLGRNELVLSLSDGQIDNWEDIKDKYIKYAKGNEYIHFQIGNFSRDNTGKVTEKPKMCKDLEYAGLPVYYDDGKSLGKLVVDLTRPYITRSEK